MPFLAANISKSTSILIVRFRFVLIKLYLNFISLLFLNSILNLYMGQISSSHGTKNTIWGVFKLLQSMLIVHNQTSTRRLIVQKLSYIVINYLYIVFCCCSSFKQTVYKIYKLLFTTLSMPKLMWYCFAKINIFFGL